MPGAVFSDTDGVERLIGSIVGQASLNEIDTNDLVVVNDSGAISLHLGKLGAGPTFFDLGTGLPPEITVLGLGGGAAELVYDSTVPSLMIHDAENNGKTVLADGSGNEVVTICAGNGQALSFFGAPTVVQQTGVPVTAAGIHAALVAYGLITA